MAAITQTITIVDKSNKVVSSAKQLKGVFAEAKYAYQARKAEIKAERQKKEDRELRKAIKACSIAEDEARSQVSSASRSRRPEGSRRRSGQESSQVYRSGSHSPPTAGRQMSLGQFNQQLYGPSQGQQSSYPNPTQTLQRSQTFEGVPSGQLTANPPSLNRSYSATDVDLDLAYGEFYDSDGDEHDPHSRSMPNMLVAQNQEKELSSLVTKCKMLLDEADCAGQSAKAIITHLQANPDAMAAVALTLAEISNIASKMAPGALVALKGSAPAVMALLASPQFLVAVGLGIGVTVVMLGGYKIIKKIKVAGENAAGQTPMMESPMGVRQVDMGDGNELLDVKELDRIEMWRRGIADSGPDADTASVVSGYSQATSVEGEFITPFAAQSMGHLPLPKEKSKKSKKDGDDKERKKHRKHKHSDRDSVDSDGRSSKSDSSRRRGSKELVVAKKPSPLRRMFTVS